MSRKGHAVSLIFRRGAVMTVAKRRTLTCQCFAFVKIVNVNVNVLKMLGVISLWVFRAMNDKGRNARLTRQVWRGARRAVVEALTGLLNQASLPTLHTGATNEQVLRQVAQAVQSSAVAAPGLSEAEWESLQAGQAGSTGIGAVALTSASALLQTATCVAALSAEALGADVCPQILHMSSAFFVSVRCDPGTAAKDRLWVRVM